MIALDTNILLRILVEDDPLQAARVRALLETLNAENPGYISQIVLVELAWVLASNYGYQRTDVAHAIHLLMRSTALVVEGREAAEIALDIFKANPKVDFDDSLIAQNAIAAGCEYTATFDKTAAKHAGMRLI